jgi:hypothetical protein
MQEGGAMIQTTRWMMTVSSDADRLVRRFLATAGRKGDLSRFVEEAVKSRLLEESLRSGPTSARRSANDGERPPVEADEVGERQQSG